jgi:biopolymer transport protein TolR
LGTVIGGKKGVVSDMNVVPLIDILLVLIIIFMVITPTISKGEDTLIPQPPPPGVKVNPDLPPQTIVVQVVAGDKVLINHDETTWDQLGPRLQDIFKQRAEKVAFVKGDSSVEFAQVARAIDIMRTSGIDKVGLMPTGQL